MELNVDLAGKTAVYRQLLQQIESGVRSGSLKDGEQLPSVNELAGRLGISRETVKKVYYMLKDRGVIDAHQGKGFYARSADPGRKSSVLIIMDSLSSNMQAMLDAFSADVKGRADITILLHNQNLDLFEYYLDENLGRFDYYLVAPHFVQTEESIRRAVKLVSRVPVNKLIMIDNFLQDVRGRFGAVYQKFDEDICTALSQVVGKLRKSRGLDVVVLKNALYGKVISAAAARFCSENGIPYGFVSEINYETVKRNGTYLILNGHLDNDLVRFAGIAADKGLIFGKDIFLISYNESVLSPLVLGGLTTVSADFAKMGHIAAEMILNRCMSKVHCPFNINTRNTF